MSENLVKILKKNCKNEENGLKRPTRKEILKFIDYFCSVSPCRSLFPKGAETELGLYFETEALLASCWKIFFGKPPGCRNILGSAFCPKKFPFILVFFK